MMHKIKLVTVDDSKLMQDLLWKILKNDSEIEIVGMAYNPYEAREIIKKENPDVITLDIMMPEMDGLTFLRNLMKLRPMPVVMLSSFMRESHYIALEALELGAIDFLPKPSQKDLEDLSNYKKNLIEVIKMAANAKVRSKEEHIKYTAFPLQMTEILMKTRFLHQEIIAIGASTGGVEAIESILSHLPKIMPAILIVQHIRQEFSQAFAKRINQYSHLTVCEASHNMQITPGHVYVAPANKHLLLRRKEGSYQCHLKDTLAFNGYKPSIDILFNSVATVAGEHSIGILLTGMGKDGAEGLKLIKDAGGATIVQDEKTSVVWGMPGAAVKLNAANAIVPLQEIAKKILMLLELKSRV